MIKKILTKCAAAGLVLALGPMAAHAVAIYDINMEVRTSTYQVVAGDTSASLLSQFYNNGTAVCDVSLAAVDLVGSSQTCGGPGSNIATLITVEASHTGFAFWRFGPDWGRGGIVFATVNGDPSGETDPYTDDLWWALNWANTGELVQVRTNGDASYPGRFVLGFLGFEGCCGGAMSLEYSIDGQTWQLAAVNAPEPGTLALFGLGLLGLGLARRKKV